MSSNNSFGYSKRISTRIWKEKPSEDNPYAADECRLQGYNLTDLVGRLSFAETLLLLFTGELPSPEKAQLMDALMVAFINPGPRHPATRSAMIAGASKSNSAHILPIGLITLGGNDGGVKEVEQTIQFIVTNRSCAPEILASELTNSKTPQIPGIGSLYGDTCMVTANLAKKLLNLPGRGDSLVWMSTLIDKLDQQKVGWLPTGLFAATMVDLGLAPREGGALYQLVSAPGILAHGLEQTHKPLRAFPFLEDEQYEFSQNQS